MNQQKTKKWIKNVDDNHVSSSMNIRKSDKSEVNRSLNSDICHSMGPQIDHGSAEELYPGSDAGEVNPNILQEENH